MKNKLSFLFNSLRQSVVNKPFAFILLVFMFFATTICCSIPSRIFTGGIREDRSSPNYISFKIAPNVFKQSSVEIGDYIKANSGSVKFDGYEVNSHLIAYHYNAEIKFNDSPIKLERMSVYFAIDESYGISENDIVNKQKVVLVGENTAKEYGIQTGNIVNLYGNDLVVKEIMSDSGCEFALPYNLPISKWYSCTPPPSDDGTLYKEAKISGYIRNVKYTGLDKLEKGLQKLGCEINHRFDFGILVGLIIVLGMLSICILSSISIIGYWLKCNNKKYSTYKTLGCSPTMLAFAMIIETLIVAVFSIGLGLIADYLIGVSLQFKLSIVGYEWMHYLIMIGGPLLTVLTIAIIAVIKRAVAMPANTKYNG